MRNIFITSFVLFLLLGCHAPKEKMVELYPDISCVCVNWEEQKGTSVTSVDECFHHENPVRIADGVLSFDAVYPSGGISTEEYQADIWIIEVAPPVNTNPGKASSPLSE